MRAVTVQSGQVRVSDVPKPQPGQGDVLIQVEWAGICSSDLQIVKGYGGFNGILGHEFVGVVVEGSRILESKRVVGEINCVCGRCDMCSSGLASHCRRRTVAGIQGRPGVFAEFVALPERNCHRVPDAVTDEEAVFTEPLAAAFQVLHQVQIERRSNVAVIGAGRLGLLVAQVLAQTGCRLVAIGRNPKTLGFLDRRGVRTATIENLPGRNEFDVVVDCTGSPDALPTALELVRPRGTVVMKSTLGQAVQVDMTPLVVNEITLLGSRCGPFGEALGALACRHVDVASMITQRLPLNDAVEALELAGQPNHIKILLRCAD